MGYVKFYLLQLSGWQNGTTPFMKQKFWVKLQLHRNSQEWAHNALWHTWEIKVLIASHILCQHTMAEKSPTENHFSHQELLLLLELFRRLLALGAFSWMAHTEPSSLACQCQNLPDSFRVSFFPKVTAFQAKGLIKSGLNSHQVMPLFKTQQLGTDKLSPAHTESRNC